MNQCHFNLRFAFDLTTKILPFFEDYFGIRFDLPKIDMVAVPEFGFSAMENWGLITFRSVRYICKLHHLYRFEDWHCHRLIIFKLI